MILIQIMKSEIILELYSKKILLTHGHFYGVKNGLNRLINKAKQLEVNAVFFGHTHIPKELYHEKTLFINPGSIGYPIMNNKPTYCEVELNENTIRTNIIKL
jgi:putative phosphoesterase